MVTTKQGESMRRTSTLAVAVAACLSVATADAQEWPARPVQIVVPFAPGGAADILGRLLADQLSLHFNQPFVVDNNAGGGGVVGSAIVANADPDGYALVLSGLGSHVISPTSQLNPGFDPVKSFTHVAYIAGTPIVIVANPSLGVKSFKDLRAKLKRSKTATSYISTGAGTLGNLVAESWARKEKVKLAHVASRGTITAVAAPAPLGALSWTTAVAEIRNKTVIPLAVSSAKRMPQFPDVPTLKELGYPDLVATNWYALSGPARLPPEIRQKLNSAVAVALDTPVMRARLDVWGMSSEKMSPGEVTAFVESEVGKWGPLVVQAAARGPAR
jgi:tripartite-type tricarboxylate transporter receptor subunit TctC